MILKTDYAAHADFVAPARRKKQIWRLLAGLSLAVCVYMVLSRVYFQTAYGLAGAQAVSLHDQLIDGDTPLAMFLLLGSFVFMALAAGISARVLHNRSMLSLLGPIPVLIRDFRAVSVVVLVVFAVVFALPPWGMDEPLVPNTPIGLWIVLVPLALIAVLVQVSAEEIVFRGYIQQQLAARFRSPWLWMVLPSVLFAMGHYLPDSAGENAGLIALWAGMFGILMADLTARSGSLGPAIAVHFWNNAAAMLIMSLPDELSGLALYLTPFEMSDADALRPWLWVDFASMIVLWLAARLAIRR